MKNYQAEPLVHEHGYQPTILCADTALNVWGVLGRSRDGGETECLLFYYLERTANANRNR